MRILSTYMGGAGHVGPMVPLALVAGARGHEVAFVALPGTARHVEGAGFLAVVYGFDREYEAEHADLHARANALPTIAEREDLLLRDGFAGLHARRQVGVVLRACAEWRPDLLAREEADFGPRPDNVHIERFITQSLLERLVRDRPVA